MNKFTSIIAAAIVCGSISANAQDIKVSPAFDDNFEPTFKFNSDYKYYGIYLDDDTKAANLSDDQYVYIGADDNAGRHLYVWNETYTFNTPSGVNSFGVPDSYISLKVGNVGWSGLGYANDNPMDLTDITSDYTLHLAIKSTSKQTFIFKLADGKINGGETAMDVASIGLGA